MKTLTLWRIGFVLCSSLAVGQYPPLQPLPSITPRSPEVEHRLPTDQPQQVEARLQRRPLDAAQLKRDAAELAKLAQSIPPEIEQVGKGRLPKDLNGQLKRIEKLSKQLRRELSQ